LYHISAPYWPEAARGLRWDDPHLGIAWPACSERILSERDAALPFLADQR
jgi:dTDP-4-dehydrorhamnose 3,5-epimerase